MFGLAVTSMTSDSPTFDEQGFLVRGLAYLRGDEEGSRNIRVGHPLGLNALNAALLVHDPTVALPTDHPSWQGTDFHRPAELFLWEIGNDVGRVMFLARMPTIWLGLLLAAACGRWAAEIARKWNQTGRFSSGVTSLFGLLALCLVALDPNILAHARLITTDLGLTAAAAAAGYTQWRFLHRPGYSTALTAGIFIGLLLNTKFTALLFLPLFAVVIAVWLGALRYRGTGKYRPRLGQMALMIVIVMPAGAFLALWAGNGFDVAPLATPLPFLGQLGGIPVPLAGYLDQLLDIRNRLDVSTPSFLLGNHSDSGWWYYFPVAFLLKTPLPVLLLLLWAGFRIIALAVRRSKWFESTWIDLAALLVPPVGYFLIALTTSVNLGYRHLLPILPFLFVFIAVIVGQHVAEAAGKAHWRPARGAMALVSWLLIVTLWLYPYYLAFFNALAGGPDGGWRALVDSNIDWGQDLGRLAEWLDANQVDDVWLSYFGEARPDHYGISYTGLDSFPPRLMNPLARPYYPHDPAPGWYAISATTLQGVHFDNHDQFLFFRNRRPETKIGYSIFLYRQPARGTPVDLLLSGIQIDQIEPADYARLGTNDVMPRWFDGSQAVILPDGRRPVWLASGVEGVHPLLESFISTDEAASPIANDGYVLYQVSPQPPEPSPELTSFHLGAGEITFISMPERVQDESSLTVGTAWRQDAGSQPVKIFVHLLDSEGGIAAQWDGLGAAWEGWRQGDTLIQTHEMNIADLAPGTYHLVAGLYDPESLQRWTSSSGGDRIELGVVTVHNN